jgi:MFS family permease
MRLATVGVLSVALSGRGHILTRAVPAEKRGAAFGAWSGIQGLAVAIGPLVGGAVTEGISWQWIFWLNVPLGLLLLPFARTKLTESHGPKKNIDLPGIGLASAGLARDRLGARARQKRRLAQPRDHWRGRLRDRRAGRIHRLGAAHRHPDAADALLP